MSLRKFGHEMLGYGLGIGLTKALALLSLPLITSFFSQAQVGLIELSLSLITIIIVLVTLGLDTGLTFFYWDTEEAKSRGEYIVSAITVMVTTAFFAVICLIFLDTLLSKYYFKSNIGEFYAFLIATVVLHSFFALLSKVLRIRRQVFKYNIVCMLNGFIFLGLLYFLLNQQASVSNYFSARIGGFFVAIGFIVFFIRKEVSNLPSLTYAKKLFSYSIPLVPFAIVSALMALTDKLVINHFMTLEDVGIYGIGTKIGMIVGLLISAFSMSYGPYAMSIKNLDDSHIQYAKLFKLYFYVMLGLVLVLATFDDELVRIFTAGNADFVDAQLVVAPIALSLVIHSFFSQLGIGLNITKKNRFFFFGALIALVLNLALNLIFVPMYGIIAAAWTNVFANSAVCVWIYFVNKRAFSIPYPLCRIGVVGLCFIISIACVGKYGIEQPFEYELLILFAYFAGAGFITFRKNQRRLQA